MMEREEGGVEGMRSWEEKRGGGKDHGRGGGGGQRRRLRVDSREVERQRRKVE